MVTVGNIFSKVINVLYWSYFYIGFFVWIYLGYSTIRHALYNPTQLVYVVSSFIGLMAIFSYLNKDKAGSKGFWRLMLILIPLFFLTATSSLYVSAMYLLPLFPMLYAMYKMGFDNGIYELYYLLKKQRRATYDMAVWEYTNSDEFMSLSLFKQRLRLFDLRISRP